MKPLSLGFALLLLSFAATPHGVFASSGDRLPEYEKCLSSCLSVPCDPSQFPLSLRLTRWSCLSNCQYNCTHTLTTENIASPTAHVHQYYGKWPFWRFGGAQEPASVAFSILNLLAHLKGGKELLKRVRKGHPMRGYYKVWIWINVNAWVWSSVFHTRDVPKTEKLDYFSAALTVVYSLFMTVVRFFHLYNQPDHTPLPSLTSKSRPTASQRSRKISLRLWKTICLFLFLAHITYLSILPRFDYTYNMAFNITLALIYTGLWISFSMPFIHFKRYPYSPPSYIPNKIWWKPGTIVILTAMAMSLELMDFAPLWRVFDAHAVWHLSTAPVVVMWYGFLVEDSLDEGWSSKLSRI